MWYAAVQHSPLHPTPPPTPLTSLNNHALNVGQQTTLALLERSGVR